MGSCCRLNLLDPAACKCKGLLQRNNIMYRWKARGFWRMTGRQRDGEKYEKKRNAGCGEE
jgi:hypothetical protein